MNIITPADLSLWTEESRLPVPELPQSPSVRDVFNREIIRKWHGESAKVNLSIVFGEVVCGTTHRGILHEIKAYEAVGWNVKVHFENRTVFFWPRVAADKK